VLETNTAFPAIWADDLASIICPCKNVYHVVRMLFCWLIAKHMTRLVRDLGLKKVDREVIDKT